MGVLDQTEGVALMQLTDAQVSFFRTFGYLILRNYLTAAEIQE